MNIVLNVAFRNLFRQKRRTVLLGIGIAFSIAILVIVDALTGGISDIILNRIIVNQFGHVRVSMTEKLNDRVEIIRDKNELISIISNTYPGMSFEIRENAGAMVRLIGNTGGDFAFIAGSDKGSLYEYFKTLTLLEGNLDDWTNDSIENPVVLFSDKAERLGLKALDTVKARLTTVNGQVQTARLTVAAILKSENQYMDIVMFARLDDMKRLLDMKPFEIQNLSVVFDKLKNAMLTLSLANQLHDAIRPYPAAVYGDFASGGRSAQGTLFGFTTNTNALSQIAAATGADEAVLNRMIHSTNAILLGETLAARIGARTGSTIGFAYDTRYEGRYAAGTFRVAGIVSSTNGTFDNAALIVDKDLYKFYFRHCPVLLSGYSNAVTLAEDMPFYSAIAPSWYLLPRTVTSQAFRDKWKLWNRTKWYGRTTDVVSMQELAEQFLQIEGAIRMISVLFVLILFFIIMVGVINTLRMTIRERTREIGTIRAIGMNRSMLMKTFVIESVLLSFFASIGGVIAGALITGLISLIPFSKTGGMSMLLDNGHIHFLFNLGGAIVYTIVICLVTALTALFPAYKAAKMSVANALRHYE